MARRESRRDRARGAAGARLAGVLGASLLAASGCSTQLEKSDRPHRGAAATRNATSDACTLSSRRSRVLGLPIVDAETVRISPGVVGEKIRWRSGPRQVTAWVGVDALDAFEDLDFVPLEAPPSGQSRAWTTRVRPDLFIAEAPTGNASPCDLLYISTEGLSSRAALEVAHSMQVSLTPGADLNPQ